MNGEQIAGLVLAVFVMGVGVVGAVVPGLPSTPLVIVAAVGHRLYFGDQSASNLVLVVLAALTALSLVLDYLATMLGAKKLGASWRGVTGAVAGAIAGLFFSIPGLILGPFVGAVLGEMSGGREWKAAARAGAGALLGLLLGAVGKLACCFAMIALFVASVILRSNGGT